MSFRFAKGILVASAASDRRDEEEVPSGMSRGMRGEEGEDVCERKIFMVRKFDEG